MLQLLYQDVASHEEKNALYRALWGKEMTLFAESEAASFASLAEEGSFTTDPMAKPRVLRRLEIVLSKAARKGLALTSLVQRGGAEMLEHGEASQRAELVAAFKDQAVHMMHTKEGAPVACGCVRYGDARDRKAILKALKGFASRAAIDPNGTLVLCTALEAVDDTVLIGKGLLAEVAGALPGVAMHPQEGTPTPTRSSRRAARRTLRPSSSRSWARPRSRVQQGRLHAARGAAPPPDASAARRM